MLEILLLEPDPNYAKSLIELITDATGFSVEQHYSAESALRGIERSYQIRPDPYFRALIAPLEMDLIAGRYPGEAVIRELLARNMAATNIAFHSGREWVRPTADRLGILFIKKRDPALVSNFLFQPKP